MGQNGRGSSELASEGIDGQMERQREHEAVERGAKVKTNNKTGEGKN